MPTQITEISHYPTSPDRAPWFVCVLRGPEFIFEYVNDAYCQSFGSNNYIGCSLYNVMPGLEAQGLNESARNVYNSGKTYAEETPILLQDDLDSDPCRSIVCYTDSVLRNNDGKITHLLAEGRLWRSNQFQAWSVAERASKLGAKSLSDCELLSVFLQDHNGDQSSNLLRHFGSLRAVFSASDINLEKINRCLRPTDLHDENALSSQRIKVASEIQRRVLLQRISGRALLSSSRILQAYLKLQLSDETREQFRVIFLDSRLQLIADEVMSQGTIDQANVYPREVIRRALELSAGSIILVHNHPAGNCRASVQDFLLTKEIVAAASVLDIHVHDHLIVAGNSVTSMRKEGSVRFS